MFNVAGLSLSENLKLNDTYAVHYDAARILRIMTIFDPIELVNGEVIGDFDGTNNGSGGGGSSDADDIPDPDANKEQEIPNIL